jgi:hypothetical protein
MAEGAPSFSHPDSPPPVHPPENRVEQRVSEQSVRALVDKYSDVSRQYHERPWNEAYSKEKGIVEGRRSALDNILEKVGQSNVVQKVDRQVFNQVFNGKPAEPVDLAPVAQPGNLSLVDFLADYQHQYMLKSLSAESRPHIGIVDRFTGRAKEINAFFDYGSGINEGKLAEMKGFLQTMGLGVQMDSIQQHADRMLQGDPQGMHKQVEEQLARKSAATVAKLREEEQKLKEGIREFDAILAEESPNTHNNKI